MKKKLYIISITAIILIANALAGVSGPYTPDADTLHLYHFDGSGDDAVTAGAIDLSLINGATTADGSVSGFGTALNTHDDTTGDAPSAAAPDDISIANFVGADGAFTFEALIKPVTELGAQLNHMQIISGEGDGDYDRCWQFRINTANQLEFINLVYAWSGGTESFTAAIPTTGNDAYTPGNWYHVAVTYNGQEGTADNLKLYWTKLNSSAAEAQILASFRMESDLFDWWTPAIDFAVGNDGRDHGGFSENFEGLIDEVRISSVARPADDMLVVQGTSAPVMIANPEDTTVNQTQTAVFETVFTSESTPAAAWYKEADAGDIYLDPADANIDVRLGYDAGAEQYTSTLTLSNVLTPDTGRYYCQLLNDAGYPVSSQTANLLVYGLVAHWTLNQDRCVGGEYLEEMAGYNAAAAGTPTFVTGADDAPNGAVQISAANGWALCPPLDPVQQSSQLTISFWANWGQTQSAEDDLTAVSTDDESLTAANGLKADGQWQHICTVFDGAAGKLYMDGILQDENSWQLPADTEAVINIGVNSAGLNAFNGSMDDIRLYNYAFDVYDVADLRYGLSGQGTCIPGFADQFDITGPSGQPDCAVDSWDLEALAADFLQSGSPCDLTGPTGQPDGIVDLHEFADLAASWLSCGLYPACE